MEKLLIGKIAAAHGIKGLVKIFPLCEDVSLLEQTKEHKITLKNPLGKYILAEIEGISDRNAAENISGTELFIDRDSLPEPEEGEFYIEDLIGRDIVEGDKTIGTLLAVENFGAGDLFEIRLSTGSESFYLPFNDDYVIEIGDVITVRNHKDMIIE